MRSYPLFILFAAFALGAENLLPNGNFDEGKTEALHWEKVDNLTSFWRTDGARGRILELDTRPERYQVLEYQKKRKENPATPPPKPSSSLTLTRCRAWMNPPSCSGWICTPGCSTTSCSRPTA